MASLPKRFRLPFLTAVSCLAIAGILALRPPYNALTALTRAAGMLGYLFVFYAIVASAFKKQVFRLLGIPFMKVHHTFAVSGLLLMTVHPLFMAAELADPGLLAPRLDSLESFLTFGGHPAWALFVIAAAAAMLSRRIPHWRALHQLTYPAFLLGTVHAVKIGTDVGVSPFREIALAMAAIVVAVWIGQRIQNYRRKTRAEKRPVP
ncbi:MAG: hypothetical protein K9L28_10130 [Synergistales bacterium]|nr:hypothetical protein [Synergistales bacterium]